MSRIKANLRDVSPFLQKVRNILLGREHITALRFTEDIATRSPPQPDLPEGPHHRLHTNYYFSRDARRDVTQPEIVATGQTKLQSGTENDTLGGLRRPGPIYNWD